MSCPMHWKCYLTGRPRNGRITGLATLVWVLLQLSCGQPKAVPVPANPDSTGPVKHEDLHNQYHDDGDRNHVDASLEAIMVDMTQHLNNLHKSNRMDHDFSAIMKVLVQAELEASYLAVAKSADSGIRSMAASITREERASLGQWDAYKSAHIDDSLASQSFYSQVSGYLRSLPDFTLQEPATFDQRFSAWLTHHHNVAISLIQIYVAHEGDTVLQKKAAAIAAHYKQQTRLINLNRQ